jgi:hypothetical protein
MLLYKPYTLAGFEPGSSVPEADEMPMRHAVKEVCLILYLAKTQKSFQPKNTLLG